jgi:cytochrome P450
MTYAARSHVVPPMPPFAASGVGGLQVLRALRHNGFSAFPSECLDSPVLNLRIPGRTLALVCAPDPIRYVLQTHAEDYVRLPAGRRVLGPIAGRGLLVSEGKAWRRQRRAMAPAFTPRAVPVLAGHIARCADITCAGLEASASQPLDLLATMQRLSLDIASVSMFSLQSESFGSTLRGMVTHFMATIGRPAASDFLLPAGLPTPLMLRRALFRRRWRRLIAGVIATREATHRPGSPRDLFDLMKAAHGEGDPGLLADEVATMIVAGHETTALTLFWTCLLLAQAPDWQHAVAREACSVDLSPGRAAASLPALVKTRAVVQEALRLYPPAFMTARLATRGHNLCGVHVPAGAMVLIPFWLLHRNPRWWTAPEVFDPSRFLGGPEPDRFAFLPFGAGPHVCIGAQLALTEAVLVVARLLRGSVVELVDQGAVLPVGVLSTRPDHAPLFQLRPRSTVSDKRTAAPAQ